MFSTLDQAARKLSVNRLTLDKVLLEIGQRDAYSSFWISNLVHSRKIASGNIVLN